MGCTESKTGVNDGGDGFTWEGGVLDPKKWTLERPVTKEQLYRMREEFWETRIEGQTEMWEALKAAAEADGKDLRTQIVMAAGIKPALKRKTLELVWDERGMTYEVPMYCLSEPTNLDAPGACEEMKDARMYLQSYNEAHKPRLVGHRT